MTEPLEMVGVSFGYGEKEVLRDVSLSLCPGELTLLAAPNGAGKSTCMMLAAGLLEASGGSVKVFGDDPFRVRRVLGRVGVLSQGMHLPTSWTVREVLSFQQATFPQWNTSYCEELVAQLGVEMDRVIGDLSRGEQGKVTLLATLCTRPELLLLDEPTLGLDVATKRLLHREILEQLVAHGSTILLASHDIAELEPRADRFAFLDGGEMVLHDSVESLLARHRVLLWKGMAAPPRALAWHELPSVMGNRALATQWDEEMASEWVEAGGEVEPAELELVYLSLSGELDCA